MFMDIKKHQATRCKIAKKRRKLIEEKAERLLLEENNNKKTILCVPIPPKTKTEGELLEESIRARMVEKSRIRHMLEDENRKFALEDHRLRQRVYEASLFDIFAVDPEIEERAERARKRRLDVDCPNCGEPVVAMWLEKHLVNACVNRKVPCRNWELGCPTFVRMRDRATHESVEHLLKPRPCLKFNGIAGFIELKEENDIKPPWTAEYWICRWASEASETSEL